MGLNRKTCFWFLGSSGNADNGLIDGPFYLNLNNVSSNSNVNIDSECLAQSYWLNSLFKPYLLVKHTAISHLSTSRIFLGRFQKFWDAKTHL